jgi:hypothetical protein
MTRPVLLAELTPHIAISSTRLPCVGSHDRAALLRRGRKGHSTSARKVLTVEA